MSGMSWALAGVLIGLLPAPSAEAQLWSAPADLGAAGDTPPSADVAVDPDGAAVVAWAWDGGRVQAAVRSASGGFGPAAALAPDGGRAVAVASDGAGGALVAWWRNGTLGLAERTAGAPVLTEVATGVAGIATGPDVAFKVAARRSSSGSATTARSTRSRGPSAARPSPCRTWLPGPAIGARGSRRRAAAPSSRGRTRRRCSRRRPRVSAPR